MLPQGDSYEAICSQFTWDAPEFYNIGQDVCDKWADTEPQRLALIFLDHDGHVKEYTFQDIKALSNRTANLLSASGVGRGDRVGILLPQCPETAFAHAAIFKLGAISIPLFTLFGVQALQYRLENSGAKAIVTNEEGARKIKPIRDQLTALKHIFVIDGPYEGCRDFHAEMSTMSPDFAPLKTRADDPALIIYTSGTTGQPKGALHAHRVLLGHLPGVEISHNLLPQPGDRIWTPADWAWIGGLLDVLLPAWHHGVTVVAHRFRKFTAEAAFELLDKFEVRNAFIPPTALKMMRSLDNPQERYRLDMRSIASGGETLGAELLAWGEKVFGLTINEFYGQTECNMIVSSCSQLMPARPGVMGRPVPGCHLAILDDQGRERPPGELGHIAVKKPNPVMFLEYWNDPHNTAKKFIGEYLITGDLGQWEDNQWIRFVGRDDDVITSAGYRIGPGEIEDCLLSHPAVKISGVVGKPDPERTQIVKAFIILNDGYTPGDALAEDIQQFVKTQLAAHEYPREIEFVDELPFTTTGKLIRRELRQRA